MPTPTIGPSPGKLNLSIRQGSTFDQTLTWKDADENPIDLTGYDARAQIREETSSATPLLSLTVLNGRLTLGGALGTIRILISATDTALLDFDSAVWDLEVISGSVVVPLVAGSVTLPKEVTR